MSLAVQASEAFGDWPDSRPLRAGHLPAGAELLAVPGAIALGPPSERQLEALRERPGVLRVEREHLRAAAVALEQRAFVRPPVGGRVHQVVERVGVPVDADRQRVVAVPEVPGVRRVGALDLERAPAGAVAPRDRARAARERRRIRLVRLARRIVQDAVLGGDEGRVPAGRAAALQRGAELPVRLVAQRGRERRGRDRERVGAVRDAALPDGVAGRVAQERAVRRCRCRCASRRRGRSPPAWA